MLVTQTTSVDGSILRPASTPRAPRQRLMARASSPLSDDRILRRSPIAMRILSRAWVQNKKTILEKFGEESPTDPLRCTARRPGCALGGCRCVILRARAWWAPLLLPRRIRGHTAAARWRRDELPEAPPRAHKRRARVPHL